VAPLIGFSPNRRGVLRSAAALVATPGMSFSIPGVHAASDAHAAVNHPQKVLSGQKLVGFMLAHEQFTVSHLTDLGAAAARAGFGVLATSDHFQPWQANEGHCGGAWVTLGALGGRTEPVWIGTTVTCPILRYHPAVVAEVLPPSRSSIPVGCFLGWPPEKMPDPAAIERRAGEEQPLDRVFADWPIGTDPAIHISALQKLFDSGATIVNVHSGQADQNKVIDFYRRLVLPEFAQAVSSVAH
jgi:Luciferase-like monooxygenase